jgi:uncharacterized delta-60 repeat protein
VNAASLTRQGLRPLVAAAVFVTVCSSVAVAAAAGLDSTFSGDGKTTTDLTPREDWASAVVIQPDGKIVVAGVAGYGKGARIGVARYRANGKLDTTFGGDGKVTTNLTKSIDYAYDMALQPDGKIVATGEAGFGSRNPKIGVVRYNADGTLDTFFGGGDGKVLTDVTGREDWGDGIAVQADGKIVVGGGCGYSNTLKKGVVCAVRYNADGALDSAFGNGGARKVDVTPTRDFANSMTLQSDGKVVLAGESGFGSPNPNFVVVRLDTEGAPDPTFSGNGVRTVPVTMRHDAALAVQVQPDGKIVAAGGGGWTQRHPGKFAAVRLNPDGKLDPSFAGDGIRIVAMPITNSLANGLAIQPDGKLVLAGWAGNQIAVARWNSDGSADTTFSGDGRLTTRITRHGDAVYAVALQPDGKIVVAGEAGYGGSNPKIAVLRYNGS